MILSAVAGLFISEIEWNQWHVLAFLLRLL